jgi:hypothetical protein
MTRRVAAQRPENDVSRLVAEFTSQLVAFGDRSAAQAECAH